MCVSVCVCVCVPAGAAERGLGPLVGSLSATPKDKKEEGPRAAMPSEVPVPATGTGTLAGKDRAGLWEELRLWSQVSRGAQGGLGLRVQDKVEGLPGWWVEAYRVGRLVGTQEEALALGNEGSKPHFLYRRPVPRACQQ